MADPKFKPGDLMRHKLTGLTFQMQADGSWLEVKKVGGQWQPSGTQHPKLAESMHSEDVATERPSDRYLKESASQKQRTAAQEVQSGNVEHAPIQEPDNTRMQYLGGGRYASVQGKPDLYDEMQRAATEEIPVTRTRSGQPSQEPRYNLGERIAATVAPTLAGLVVGAERGLTSGISALPARAIAPEGQRMAEELAGRSAVTTPVTLGTAFLPQSVGSRVGTAAARMVPAVAEGAPMAMRGVQALGQALAAGTAASGVQATTDAAANAQRGMPVREAARQIPEQVGQGAMASLALAPPIMGVQALARSAARALPESPDLGPDVVAVRHAGLDTQATLPIPGMRPMISNRTARVPEQGGVKMGADYQSPARDDLVQAQKEQAVTGEPAARINARRAAGATIADLDARRQAMRARHGQESALFEATPEGQQTVSTQPVIDYLQKAFAESLDQAGRPLPKAQALLEKIKGNLSEFADARLARPGEEGIPWSVAKELGFNVELPAQKPRPSRAPGESMPDEGQGLPTPELDVPERPTIPDPSYPGGEVPDRLPPPPRVPRMPPLPPDASVARIQAQLGVGAAEALKIQERLRAGESIGGQEFPETPPGKPMIYPEPPVDERQTVRAPPPGRPEDFGKDPLVVLTPRQLDARGLETSRRLYDVSSNVSQNKELETAQAQSERGIADVMRSLRSGFRWPPGMGEPPRATISTGEAVTGYPALKQTQHEQMTALENQFKSVGLNPKLDRLSPKDVTQLSAVMNKIEAAGTALERELPDVSPETMRQLKVAAAHISWDRLMSRAPQVHPSATALGGGNPTRQVVNWRGSLALLADPYLRAIGGPDIPPGAGAQRGAGQAGSVGAQVDPALLKRFLGMIGLGDQPEDQKQ